MRFIVDAEDLFAWLDDYRKADVPKERVQLAIRLGKLVREYEISAYLVDTDDERVLRHVFYRVNRSGKPLKEADVFDALHGMPGQAEPGELGEVADRLRTAGFGDFDTDLLLRTLRALLGQDVATDYGHLLPDGVHPGEALARTERALREVIAFFREDAKIPHLRLLPYTMTVVTLAVFFDRHPHPSPRTRQLLARWIWRGAITGAHRGDTVTLRSTLSVIQEEKENVSVSALLKTLPERTHISPPSSLDSFNFGTARSKLETLALFARSPKSLFTHNLITITDLFNEEQREIPPRLVHARSASAADLKKLASTVANRLVHPPFKTWQLRKWLNESIPEDVLQSHAITPSAWRKLAAGNTVSFLHDRAKLLDPHIAAFLESRAAWNHSDRPAIKSLLIEDD